MAGEFDDLIPKKASVGEGSFDDLIPKRQVPISDNPPIQAIGDIGRLIAKGVAMGKETTPEDAADRANALMGVGQRMRRQNTTQIPQTPATPSDYQPFFTNESQEVKDAASRAGWAGTIAELGGSVAAGGPIVGGVAKAGAAASAIPAAGRVLANPFVQAGAAGAILGASNAQGTNVDKTTGAAIGTIAGLGGQAVGNALGAGVGKVAGALNARPNIPTRESIEAAKKSAYEQAEQAGVIYTPQFSQRIRSEIEPTLAKLGYDPALQPKIAPVIARIEESAKDNVTLSGVEVLRKVAGNAYDPGNKSSNLMMKQIINAIDDAANAPKAGELLAGESAAATQLLKEARKQAQIGFKLDDLSKAQEIAKLQTAAAGSGGNIDNNTRRKIAQFFLMPGKGGGLTPDEVAAAGKVVYGSMPQNLTRLVGKLSPSGNGLMAALQAGAAGATGGASLPLAAAGMAAKYSADKMTGSNVQKLVDIISSGGLKEATQSAPNGLQRFAKSERERLARLLMAGGIRSGVPLAQ